MRRALPLFLLFVPLFSSAATLPQLQAQLQILQTQLAALQKTVPTASVSSRSLSKGMRGDDLKQLQLFLIAQKLLTSDSATGFFGALTEAAVKKFQAQK